MHGAATIVMEGCKCGCRDKAFLHDRRHGSGLHRGQRRQWQVAAYSSLSLLCDVMLNASEYKLFRLPVRRTIQDLGKKKEWHRGRYPGVGAGQGLCPEVERKGVERTRRRAVSEASAFGKG